MRITLFSRIALRVIFSVMISVTLTRQISRKPAQPKAI
jgi:hypothetical protein